MKRQYWRRGRYRAGGGLSVWIALAGLVASYVYGAAVVVPQLAARSAHSSPDAALSGVADTSPSVVDQAPSSSPGPAAGRSREPESDLKADACVAAMNAALSNARIEFLSSSVELVPASRNVISVLAALAHACPGRIQIAGHSDDLGPEEVNEQISVARAEAVARAFIEFGLESERLTVLGFGSSQPIASNTTRAGRARNRRIEMSLVE
ncbi:MAG: OmpA family protein [Gammaproteobacteria bacterium]